MWFVGVHAAFSLDLFTLSASMLLRIKASLPHRFVKTNLHAKHCTSGHGGHNNMARVLHLLCNIHIQALIPTVRLWACLRGKCPMPHDPDAVHAICVNMSHTQRAAKYGLPAAANTRKQSN